MFQTGFSNNPPLSIAMRNTGFGSLNLKFEKGSIGLIMMIQKVMTEGTERFGDGLMMILWFGKRQ